VADCCEYGYEHPGAANCGEFLVQLRAYYILHGGSYVQGEHKVFPDHKHLLQEIYVEYEGWNFNSGNYLFTTDTK